MLLFNDTVPKRTAHGKKKKQKKENVEIQIYFPFPIVIFLPDQRQIWPFKGGPSDLGTKILQKY